MFENPAKRSCPSSFRLSRTVPWRFLKAYEYAPEEAMDTPSFFLRIFPLLITLLTGEVSCHQFKLTLTLRVEMTKTTADGKTKV